MMNIVVLLLQEVLMGYRGHPLSLQRPKGLKEEYFRLAAVHMYSFGTVVPCLCAVSMPACRYHACVLSSCQRWEVVC